MTTTDHRLDALRKAGRKLAKAQEARDKAMAEVIAAVRAAAADRDVTRNDIIEASGVSRRTVYLALTAKDAAPAEVTGQ